MALPVMNAPVYNMVVPSTNQPVKFRPFLVKEEKALLLAHQSEDVVTMVDSLKQVIASCVLDKIDTNTLATFDLEYMFTQIRAKSVGENVELLFSCDQPSCVDNEKARVQVNIDLTKLEVERTEGHSNRIELFGNVGIVMKYPNIQTIKRLQNVDASDIDNIFDVVAECIDYIFEGDEIYHAKEQKKTELIEFMNNLTSEQFVKIQEFFTTMPKIRKKVEYNCPVCGTHHEKTLEGMQSFF